MHTTQMDRFFSDLQKKPASPDAVSDRQRKDGDAADLPKGVVLGEDGKPYVFLPLSLFTFIFLCPSFFLPGWGAICHYYY